MSDSFIAPYVTERTPYGEARVDIYTRLLRDRIIWISSAINQMTANAIMAQLLYLESEDDNEEIYIYINSLGGDMVNGLAIYDTMQLLKPDLVTICAGNSSGIATLLLAGGTPGKRLALSNAVIHMTPGQNSLGGYAPDVEIKANFMIDMQNRIRNILSKHTGQPIEKVKRELERDTYMNAQQAIEYGIIDEIITRQTKPF